MFLQKLFLINFKNYREQELRFSPKFNCFVGNNGEGKTNLLEAIHYLSFCKSFFNLIDSQNILHDTAFFVIQGEFVIKDKTENVYCGLKRGEKKQFKLNQKEYSRLAEHIGYIPLVVVSPMDEELITGGSEQRRKFIDRVISQFDTDYLDKLIIYNKILLHRNALLKRFAENRYFDKIELEVWDTQLIPLGNEIHNKRMQFVQNFNPYFQKYYEQISGNGADNEYFTNLRITNNEQVSFVYDSQLNDNNFENLIRETIVKDRSIQYTSAGIHKDDLVFNINDYPLKKFGSQGQQKTYLTALKFAELEYLKKMKNTNPILLLDDIFDKLDETRVTRIMEIVGSPDFGQIFITDTHKERISDILEKQNAEFKMFEIKKGSVVE